MSKYDSFSELFSAIAASIRIKNGNDNKIKLEDFPSEIDKIGTGDDALVELPLADECRFLIRRSNDGWIL